MCAKPSRGERAEGQPGEKLRPSPNRTKGFPPGHPRGRGALLFKHEGAVMGAVMGASSEAPGDPYKGLRGAG